MKKLIVVVMMFLGFTFIGEAQTETLFGRARIIGAFGGPIVEFGNIGGSLSNSAGGGGGLIIDRFFIGAYGMGNADNIRDLIDDNRQVRLSYGHGGLWLGYVHNHHKILHLFSSVKLGWGGIGLDFDRDNFRIEDRITVVTPELGLELNIFKFFRVGATVGYRYVDGINGNSSFSSSDMNGIIGGLTFRFGWFGRAGNKERKKWDWNIFKKDDKG